MYFNTVMTNGCFDILHPGHIRMISFAASLGKKLIVSLDSDNRVALNKGDSRPINSLPVRTEMMYAIKGVSSVKSFNSDKELEDIILANQVEALIIGSEYKDKHIVGAHLVKKVIFFERYHEFSSTRTIERIANR